MNPAVDMYVSLAYVGGAPRVLRAAELIDGRALSARVGDQLLAEGWTCTGGTWAQPGQLGMSTSPSPDLFTSTTTTNAPENAHGR